MPDRFPIEDFRVNVGQWRTVFGAVTSGRSKGLIEQTSVTTGGPLWVFECGAQVGADSDHRKRWRALIVRMRSGTIEVEVPWQIGDLATPLSGAEPQLGLSFSDGSTFSDGSGFSSGPLLSATLTAAAARRATQISFSTSNIDDLIGGEPFTIVNSDGARLHLIGKIISQIGANYVVEIEPPLREAAIIGQALDFSDPRCLMRLQNAQEALGEVDVVRQIRPQIVFVEHFDPQSAS